MSRYALPSAPVEVTAVGLSTGLIGTLTVAVEDGQGGSVIAPTTSGIVESPAGSGIYTATLTAPSTPGEYVVVFHNPDENAYGAAALVVNLTGQPYVPPVVPTYAPAPADVARLLRARTKDSNGNELGQFTADTRPTEEQVNDLIAVVSLMYPSCLNDDLDEAMYPTAKQMLALRTAILVELSYWPEQVESERSPISTYVDLFNSLLDYVCPNIEGVGEGGAAGGGESTMPAWTFETSFGGARTHYSPVTESWYVRWPRLQWAEGPLATVSPQEWSWLRLNGVILVSSS